MGANASKPTITSKYVDDFFLLSVKASNGATLEIITPTLDVGNCQRHMEYSNTGVLRQNSKTSETPFLVYTTGAPYSSEPKSNHWDMGENIPILGWENFQPPNRIGWESVLVNPSFRPELFEGFNLSHFLKVDNGYRIVQLPFYMDAYGNRVNTGIHGRGRLGRFGPNGACDPVMTQWKYLLNDDGTPKTETKNEKTVPMIETDSDGNPILQVILIKRKDTGEWAIPGGMNVNFDGKPVEVSETLAREFLEEACAHEEDDAKKSDIEKQSRLQLQEIVETYGIDVFRGRNNDPRNTDHAWMVTVVKSIHDPKPNGFFKTYKLRAGIETSKVAVVDWTPKLALKMFANHTDSVNNCYKLQKFLLENH